MSDINIQTFSGKVQVNNNLKVGQGHLFVDTANNQVGLNTTNPLANLHVNGNTYVHSDLRVGSGIVMDQKVATFGTTKTFVVEVAGGVFQIDGVSRPALTFHESQTYIFDQSHSSNGGSPGHPIAFAEAVNGGTPYSTGVTSVGTPGQAGAKTTFKVPVGAPSNLFYYCVNHPTTMGSLAGTPSVVSTEAEIIVSGRLLATSIHGDGSALVNIPSSAINGTLSQWTDVNTNEIYYDLGNVGIGNQNPNSTLDVTGTGSFSGDLTVGTNKFFVDVSTGQVGVGTANPAAGKALDVIGDLRATYLYGDGSNINNITSSQWVTTGNDIYYDTGSVRVGSNQPPGYTLDVLGDINFTGDIRKGGVVQTFGGGAGGGGTWTEISGTSQIHYSAGNVGIANTNPQHTLSVGDNLYVEDAGSNVLVIDGNVACNQVTLGQFEIVPSYGLNDVTAESNVTTDTVELNNVTTGLSTVSNVAVGGELAVSSNLTVSGNVVVSKDLTVTENVVVSKDLTVTEELVASANVAVGNNLTVTGVSVIPGYATKISVTSPSGTESSFAYGSENYKLHTFTSNGTFTVTASGIVEYLIVAGGGGGGYGHTGGGGHAGGGGGGVLTGTMWVPVGNHAVTVGGGGAGDSSNSSGNGANGGNSTFLHQIAIGGGGGHGWANTPLTGNSGGCGGGGGGVSTGSGGRVGGYGTMNQGCNGGDGHYDDGSNNNHTGHRGGGGGGAGTPGRSWNVNLHKNNWKAFEGGDGRACSITGSQVYYGGGGGGSGIVSSYLYAIVTASGGLGGGGNGGITNSGSNAGNTAGGNGTTNTGGGGGGGGYTKNGGSGGSGIVIIRYLM
jgi:hypothetical protein